jgi:hypothetical protein
VQYADTSTSNALTKSNSGARTTQSTEWFEDQDDWGDEEDEEFQKEDNGNNPKANANLNQMVFFQRVTIFLDIYKRLFDL